MSVLGEIPLVEGDVKVHGRISYVAQQPWVFSASLRQNIVFGNKFDQAKYNKILKACALNKVFFFITSDLRKFVIIFVCIALFLKKMNLIVFAIL